MTLNENVLTPELAKEIYRDVQKTFGFVNKPTDTDAVYVLQGGKILDTKGPYSNHQHENVAKYIEEHYHIHDLDPISNGSIFMTKRANAVRLTPWLNAFYIPPKPMSEQQQKVLKDFIQNTRISKQTPLLVSNLQGDAFAEITKKPADVDLFMQAIMCYYQDGRLDLGEAYKNDFNIQSANLIKYISDTPHKGATYIGKPGYYIWAKNVDHPGLIELLDYPEEDEESIIDLKGWIRCDSGLSISEAGLPASFIELPEQEITAEQYEALLNWMINCCTGEEFQVSCTNGAYRAYDMNYIGPEDIIKIIRRFYKAGELQEDLKDEAKEYFGTTWDCTKAFYLNTDGTLLDGSGKKLGSNGDYRSVDHREVSDLFDDIDGTDAMLAYMREGNIRVKPESPGLEMIKEPTYEQYEAIEYILDRYARNRSDYYIDFSSNDGTILQSLAYDIVHPIEILADIKRFYRHSLTEDTRTSLINKSRSQGQYKDTSRGRNRFERKKYSKVANAVKQYNQIDMNDFFKKDILTVKIPVTGETDSYVVSIKLEGVCAEIERNVKNNKNKFEFRTIIQALTKIFNTGNVYVNCTCPDYLYNFDHWNIINNVSTEDTAHDPGPGKNIRNPQDDKGRGCKHILLVLNNGDWMMKVASVINNYVHYAETNMQKAFLKLIFPKIYGIPADEMLEHDLVDDEKFLDSSAGLIDAINAYGAKRGQYNKGSNKNPVTGTGGRTKKEDASNQADESTEKK